MKTVFLLFGLLNIFFGFAQPQDPVQQAYYSGINFNLEGVALKAQLATKITSTHSRNLTYSQVWDAIKFCDLHTTNTSEVVLLYGWPQGSSTDLRKAYSRNKDNKGGKPGQWNREHVYARSLAQPSLDTKKPSPGTDAHNLRASDVQWNNERGNRKFARGSGHSGPTGINWYPGDEWKGDVARMMMYMYVRYGTQCLPNNVGVGSTQETPDGMIDLFLQWNAEDPVSALEIQRNNYLANLNNPYAQGNRNPFIDNPQLATKIWKGPQAEDRWNTLSKAKNNLVDFKVYPNPTSQNKIYIQTSEEISQIQVIAIDGKIIQKIDRPRKSKMTYTLESLPKGFYIIQLQADQKFGSTRIIVQ